MLWTLKKNIYNQDDKTFGNLHHDYTIVIEGNIDINMAYHIYDALMQRWGIKTKTYEIRFIKFHNSKKSIDVTDHM